MSLQKRSSRSPTQSPPHDLKHRVITCLNKLADRDTLSSATNELESIAKNLTQDSFSSFLSCLQNTDSSSKSPVRKHCVSLLTLLSQSHGNSLAPHLSKMIATVVRRLRDPDSSVRSACIAATSAMSSHITKPSFSVVSKPLIKLVVVEQDLYSQVGGAMCLSAAIEAAPSPEVEQLRKLLPRLGKLVRTEGFKAKVAVLGVMGSVVGVGGAKNKGVLDWLVPCVVEFLSSDDWTTRKAAAEMLGKVAFVEKELASEYKMACLAALESRRFDKVKIVRETMTCALEPWKEVHGVCEELMSPTPSKSSSVDNGSGRCFPSITRSFEDVGFKTPQPRKIVPACRFPSSGISSGTTVKNDISLKSGNKKSSIPMTCKSDSNWKVEIAVPQSPYSVASADDIRMTGDSRYSKLGEMGNNVNFRPATKRVLFSRINDDKICKFGGLRSGSRVVPYHDDENSDFVISNAAEEAYDDQKDAEDISLIREQLLQIEHQQSSLLDLLQIHWELPGWDEFSRDTCAWPRDGSSEMSYDLALSSGRMPNKETAENTCCKLPGAEFLSCKFWRRTEGRFSNARLSSSGNIQSLHTVLNTPDKDAGAENSKTDNQKLRHPSGDGNILNSLADVHDLRENSRFHSNRTMKNIIQDSERSQVGSVGGLDVGARVNIK